MLPCPFRDPRGTRATSWKPSGFEVPSVSLHAVQSFLVYYFLSFVARSTRRPRRVGTTWAYVVLSLCRWLYSVLEYVETHIVLQVCVVTACRMANGC